MTPGRIEAIKIKANYVNGIAVAIFAIGGVAPLVAAANNGKISFIGTCVAFLSLVASAMLHVLAQKAALEIDNVT